MCVNVNDHHPPKMRYHYIRTNKPSRWTSLFYNTDLSE